MKYTYLNSMMICLEININMRCIEIGFLNTKLHTPARININMRCIEMMAAQTQQIINSVININMRCIEIKRCCF